MLKMRRGRKLPCSTKCLAGSTLYLQLLKEGRILFPPSLQLLCFAATSELRRFDVTSELRRTDVTMDRNREARPEGPFKATLSDKICT